MKFFISLIFLSLNFCLNAAGYDPISVYLTWTKSPESTISIQWISNKAEMENNVYYHALNEEGSAITLDFVQVTATHRPMPQGHPYLIHQVQLTGLDENTPYAFKISETGQLFKFKTLPKDLNVLRFVEGGDAYHDTIDIVENTNIQAAKLNPMFAVIGGDISYAADSSHGIFPEEFHRWMKWWVTWKKTMVTPDGYLIPILVTIGNHETAGGFGKTPMAAPFFYAFFPMPGEQGYNVLDFGDYMSLILLDSGHTHPIHGKQAEWLSNTLKDRENIPYKFAVYHVPAYPSARKFSYEVSEIVRKHWVPLFDTYSLRAAFEHHDHTYKRTFPLKNGKMHEKGVVYLGDGAWGVASPRTPKRYSPYIARTLSSANFILVTLNKEGVKYEAFNGKGELIDRYGQKK